MAAGTKSRAMRSAPTLPVVGTLVMLLVIFIVWLAKANFASGPKEPPAGPPTAQTNWVEQKAKETGGDFAKLSAEDRQKIEQMTMGHGQMALKQAHDRIKNK
jgi:hypothetical protein